MLLLVAVAAAMCLTSTAANAHQAAEASDLKVFTTRAVATVLQKIRGDVERKTGRKLSVTTDVAIRLVRLVKAGEAFDVLVAAPGQLDELIAEGMIIRDTRTDIARSGIGVAVRRGATKPDVSSLEAFTRALVDARSIAYLKEGQSGLYIADVLDRLGIADQIKPKLTLPDTDIVSQLVSRGEVELGIVVITQILTTDGVSLAGPLPPEIQSYITFTGGVSVNSQALEAANELMRMLQAPAAIGVMRSQGMEPGRRRLRSCQHHAA
ncbi:MAG TPA: substrate-binding domain-containing protein [Vicinamibacterales bacterium]|nr:substrate-binding domain-containing protein [Vicinamibacterales bacterium]